MDYFSGGRCIPGDFNGDNRTDIACNDYGSTTWRIYLSTGSGWHEVVEQSGFQIGDNDVFGKRCITGDFDGDGITDIACYKSAEQQWIVMTAAGWGINSGWSSFDPGVDDVIYLSDKCLSGDFNGDGRTDIACYMNDGTGNGNWRVAISNSSGGLDVNVWGGGSNPGASLNACKTGDFDGDGRTDIICRSDDDVHWQLMLSTVNGGPTIFGGWTFLHNIYGPNTTAHNCKVGDFNGDGKTDIVCGLSPHYAGLMAFSTGANPYLYNTIWNVLNSLPSSVWGSFYPGDFNGDGKTDLIFIRPGALSTPYELYMALSTGSDWASPYWPYGGNDLFGVPSSPLCFTGDFNGDGRADFACVYDDNHPWKMMLSTGSQPDLLSSVQNIYGGTTTISYAPSSAYQNTYLPFIVQTVSSITVDDGNGNQSTTNYTYAGGYYSAPNREFRGSTTSRLSLQTLRAQLPKHGFIPLTIYLKVFPISRW